MFFISWGSRVHRNTFGAVDEHYCEVCHQTRPFRKTVTYKTFHLWWIFRWVTQKSYQITPDELVRIRASSPSSGAPDNFSFTPFAFLATVSGGKVTKFEQVWTP